MVNVKLWKEEKRELEKAHEWYKKRKKSIYIACILSLVIAIIAFLVSHNNNIAWAIAIISGLCWLVLFLLIVGAERWKIEWP